MLRLAYLFERFPSFTQTFCYREVVELRRQGVEPAIFSIRRPEGESEGNWEPSLVRQVYYLPEEKELLHSVRTETIPAAASHAIGEWGRQTDFLRLYQAAYIGKRLADGIHLHAHFAGMAARTAYWIKQFFNVPFSFTAHANDIFSPRAFAIGLDRLVESASAIITESDYAANYLREKFPSHTAKIHRVYNGLEPANFPQANFAATIPLVLSIGRLVEKKGFTDLISACRLLADSGCDFRCEIAGDGPLRDELQTQIVRENLQDRIALSGAKSQEEIKRRLSSANVFVLPCTIEAGGGADNFPTVIAEAMVSGLPVVSTSITGIPEMVEHGVTGELVAPNDPAALAKSMEGFLTEVTRAREFGQRGRAIAQKKFAIETSVRSLREIFAEVNQ
jgi:glycosyltransferase involved in cell wall biosynthesis